VVAVVVIVTAGNFLGVREALAVVALAQALHTVVQALLVGLEIPLL
jgi:hypothetical protein